MKKNVLTSVTVSLAAAAMISGTAMAAEYKVGIIQFVDDASLNQIEQNIEKELTAKSEEGEDTYVFDGYVYNGQADSTTLNQITTQLIDDGVDVIVPIATPAAQIVQAATEDNQIPVVFSAVSDPVSAGLTHRFQNQRTDHGAYVGHDRDQGSKRHDRHCQCRQNTAQRNFSSGSFLFVHGVSFPHIPDKNGIDTFFNLSYSESRKTDFGGYRNGNFRRHERGSIHVGRAGGHGAGGRFRLPAGIRHALSRRPDGGRCLFRH